MKKIALIAEDDHFFRLRIKEVLGDRGIEADLAGSLEEALDLFSKKHYGLAVIDVMLPNTPSVSGFSDEETQGGFLSGLCLARKIKQSNGQLEIMFLTGSQFISQLSDWAERNGAKVINKSDAYRDLQGSIDGIVPKKKFLWRFSKWKIAIGALALVIGGTILFRYGGEKHIDASISLNKNALYTSDIGFLNLKQYQLGDVLIRVGNDVKQIERLTISRRIESENQANINISIRGDVDLLVSSAIPKEIEIELKSKLSRAIYLSLMNYRRISIPLDEIIASRDRILTLTGSLRGEVYIVSTIYEADKASVKAIRKGESNGSLVLEAGGSNFRINEGVFSELELSGNRIGVVYETTKLQYE